MLPGKIVRFVEEHANVAAMGTRAGDLAPHLHRVSGWRLATDHQSMAAYVPALFTEHLLEDLEDNGQVALSLEQYPSHETYQFKGRYVRWRDIEPEDRTQCVLQRERFFRSVQPLYPEVPADLIRAYILEPAVAVEFLVHEIYLQTPGPGAGARLVPPAES